METYRAGQSTAVLESFHSALLAFAPKRFFFKSSMHRRIEMAGLGMIASLDCSVAHILHVHNCTEHNQTQARKKARGVQHRRDFGHNLQGADQHVGGTGWSSEFSKFVKINLPASMAAKQAAATAMRLQSRAAAKRSSD